METNNTTLSENFFDEVYKQKEDPWNLATSDYERDKYDNTVALLPRKSYYNAFEIGCSIGVLTETLLQKCRNILAVDIADSAVLQAKARLEKYPQATVKKMTVPEDFPEDIFDLIIMSEVGYFFSLTDLNNLYEKILNNLEKNGQLLLVHWTPFVQEFPLTGDQVHEFFLEKSENQKIVKHLLNHLNEKYRIDLFEKA